MADVARLGFIGLGSMGCDLVRRAAANPRAAVTAVCDVSPERLDEARKIARKLDQGEPQSFSDYQALLESRNLDGIVVAVPQHMHAPVSIAALEAGYPTFCEKPMAINVEQCRSMINTANDAGQPLMIGQVLRYLNVYRYVLERARSGELGRPVGMRTIRTMNKWRNWARPWRKRYEQCGGMLLEVNVHEIDLMLCILGPAKRVTAVGGNFANPEVDYEDLVFAQVEFHCGALGSISSSLCDHVGKNSAEIFLEDGTIYYDSVAQRIDLCKGENEVRTMEYDAIHPEWEEGVYREVREFVETCLGEHPPTITGEDGLRAVELGQAIYTSIREKRPVDLPLTGLSI